MTTVQNSANEVQHLVGFSVGCEEYCVDILKVQEIIRMVKITRIPNAPEYVEGVINLRGSVVPVIDLRKRCNLVDATDRVKKDCRIVVVAVREKTVGLVVDNVSEVLKLERDQIVPAPDTVQGSHQDFISGVGKDGDKLLILLDVEKLITQDELDGIEQAA